MRKEQLGLKILLGLLTCIVLKLKALREVFAFFWKDTMDITIKLSSLNLIHTTIHDKESDSTWNCSFVYAHPIFSQRRLFWSKLQDLFIDRWLPWCAIGDFNEI